MFGIYRSSVNLISVRAGMDAWVRDLRGVLLSIANIFCILIIEYVLDIYGMCDQEYPRIMSTEGDKMQRILGFKT